MKSIFHLYVLVWKDKHGDDMKWSLKNKTQKGESNSLFEESMAQW
jgi:hypothetical protein